jgi:hypothetical protein
MIKEIIPNKMIFSLNDDGSFKSAMLHYRLRVDGSLDPKKFYTIKIDVSIDIEGIQQIINDSIVQVKKSEGIEEA